MNEMINERKGSNMRKYTRILIVMALVLGILLLARNNAAWAGFAGDIPQSDPTQDHSAVLPDGTGPGSVKPPPAELSTCEDGVHSVGGTSTLKVTDLAPGYCISAFLRNHAFALGRIPDGAGKVLANITFVRIFQHGKLIRELPEADGQIQICYAVPPGKQGQIYFFDFYGPRFHERTGQPAWEPLDTTLNDGMACATAQTTGSYALIGK